MEQKDKFIRALAGSVVLVGLIAGYFAHELFYLASAFAAFSLLQSSVTGICPAGMAYDKVKK